MSSEAYICQLASAMDYHPASNRWSLAKVRHGMTFEARRRVNSSKKASSVAW